jgi:beta-glucosidase
LPLSKSARSIAVIGPLADSSSIPLGSWIGDGRSEDVVSVLTGIKAAVSPATRILYAKGCEVEGDSTEGIEEAVRIARESEIALLVVGEAAEMSGEAASRSTLDLPGHQLDLVRAVHATGKPIIVVLMNGRPLTINWIAEQVPAILETWFAGTQAGHAIADVLFGDVNPGGKLAVTFPRAVGQIPIYYNHKNTGRPFVPAQKYTSRYLDLPVTPLYPFGYGLSYTRFTLTNLQLSSRTISQDGTITVSVELNNVGNREGDEVVQLYLHDLVASVTRPVRELKGFERATLGPGEKCRIEFLLTSKHLGFYDREMRFIVEPGTFKVTVGTNSIEGLETTFEVMNM